MEALRHSRRPVALDGAAPELGELARSRARSRPKSAACTTRRTTRPCSSTRSSRQERRAASSAYLDADVERRGLPVVILLTAEWHRRSADELARRYDARIGGAPPAGIEEIPIEGADERQVAYFIRPPAALVVCEIFAVDIDGELRVAESPALRRPRRARGLSRPHHGAAGRAAPRLARRARPRRREGTDGGGASPPRVTVPAARGSSGR